MTRHAEVGQQTVHVFYTVVAHPLLDIPKVAANEGESIIIDDILFGVCILVETIEVSLSTQVPQNLTAVTAATKSDIHINTIGLDSQPVNALLKKHRHMIGFSGCHIVKAECS